MVCVEIIQKIKLINLYTVLVMLTRQFLLLVWSFAEKFEFARDLKWRRLKIDNFLMNISRIILFLRAILCEVNEPGLLIGKISERFAISRYKGKESLTEKKILRNVFKVNFSFYVSPIFFCIRSNKFQIASKSAQQNFFKIKVFLINLNFKEILLC